MSNKLTGEDLEKALKDRKLPSEGTADEKRAAVKAYDAANKSSDESKDASSDQSAAKVEDDATKSEGTTTLDSHLNAPSVTAPGDGPADTTDPNELASSATPDKGAAAQAGHGTVNAVVKVGDAPEGPVATSLPKSKQRIETYEATKPDGTVVTVTHNLDTGATSVE